MRQGVLAYAARRVLLMPIVLSILVLVSFSLTSLIPGDPALVIAGPSATAETVRDIRQELGLDEPFLNRLVDYFTALVHGDLGTSFFSGRSIVDELAMRAPATLELVLSSLLVAGIAGIGIGVLGGYWRGTKLDALLEGLTTILQSIPHFVLAVLGAYLFFYTLGIAPAPVGQLPIGVQDCGGPTGLLLIDCTASLQFDKLVMAIQHLALPSLMLGLHYAPFFSRITRVKMAEALDAAHTEFARASGLSERRIVGRALLAGRGPTVTYGGLVFVSLLGGSAIVETVFSWNGLGEWAIEGIIRLDVPVVQGYVLVTGVLSLIAFLVVDIAVTALDRRIIL